MISDYCDFTMSSTFSATGQLLDVKPAGDSELARLQRRFGVFRDILMLLARLQAPPAPA